ncbi:hypothetical protein ACS0TY_015884 [Phlomoides rotata]
MCVPSILRFIDPGLLPIHYRLHLSYSPIHYCLHLSYSPIHRPWFVTDSLPPPFELFSDSLLPPFELFSDSSTLPKTLNLTTGRHQATSRSVAKDCKEP